MLRADASEAHIGGKDINVLAPSEVSRLRGGIGGDLCITANIYSSNEGLKSVLASV